jgi:hypothetical protein
MSATAGSQISWVAADSQSRDPANSTYVSGSVTEFVDDGHVGSNGVSYYGTHTVSADGSTTFGVAGNVTPPSTVNSFSGKIAGIEILHASTGMTPVSVQLDLRWDVYQLASQQVDLRWDVYNSLAKQLDLRWDVYSALAKQLDLRWDVYQRATSLLDLRWDVLERVAKQLDLRWDVYQRASSQLNLQWDVIGRVKKQLDLRWTVEAFGPALPTKPIVVNRHTDALVINRRTGIDFTAERG